MKNLPVLFVPLMLLPFLLFFTSLRAAEDKTKAPPPTVAPSAVTVTVTMTGTPTTGTCPYDMNVQWSATNAGSCNKTGAWTGTAPASGSSTVSVNGPTTTYTMTCSASNDSRQITWTNPTTNTDGTAAVIASNRVYHSNLAAEIASQNPPITLTPKTTGYMLTGLPAGNRFVAVSATSDKNIESALSATAQAVIVMPTGSKTINAGCTPPPTPKPPEAVTISSTVWDTRGSLRGNSIKVGSDVGVIALGALCLGEEPATTEVGADGAMVEYWQADKNLVRLRPGVKPRPGILVSVCKLTS